MAASELRLAAQQIREAGDGDQLRDVWLLIADWLEAEAESPPDPRPRQAGRALGIARAWLRASR